MANHTLTKAYKAWLEALQNMRSALTANPLVADPLMASAQVFEDVGRMMFGAARECEFDAQGRIVLSADQRQYAGITGIAWIVGVNNLIEIWNDEGWRRIGEATPEEYTRIQDQVAERRRAPRT